MMPCWQERLVFGVWERDFKPQNQVDSMHKPCYDLQPHKQAVRSQGTWKG